MMFRAMLKWSLVGVGLALALLVGLSEVGLTWPPGRGELTTVRGKVQSFREAPKGEIDGVVLDDGTLLHWPPHLEDQFKGIIKEGDQVEATGWQEENPEGVAQVEVKTLTNLRTQLSRSNEDDPPPPPKGPKGKRRREKERGEATTVRGAVKRFTEAPKGEIDGAVLDDGTVLHWPPHLEDQFKGIIKKGDRVEATGRRERDPEGVEKVEVRKLTNLRTQVSRSNDDAPPPPRAPREARGPREAGPGPADKGLERRVRALEDKVDRLLEEIRRLRREK